MATMDRNPDDAVRWRAAHDVLVAEFRDAGMHPDHAAEAAWYRLAFKLLDDGAAGDLYVAEAMLRVAHVAPPENSKRSLSRWTSLRRGDAFHPGDGAGGPGPHSPDLPEFFTWADGRPYTPRARASGMLKQAPSAVTFINTWTRLYGAARVEVADISREIVDMLEPGNGRTITPHTIAGMIARQFEGTNCGVGLVFKAIRLEGATRHSPPLAFQIAPPGTMRAVRPSMPAITARDPAYQPAADRLVELANLDMSTGLPAAEGENAITREMEAERVAFDVVVAEAAAAQGIGTDEARRRLHRGIRGRL